MRIARIFKLADGDSRTMRFVCGLDGIALGEGATQKTVTITRTGRFTDPRYGTFDITREMLLAMVRNFDAGTVGTDIFIDVNHDPGAGAAAQIKRLQVEGNRLRADVEFTPYGVEAVKTRGFKYLSAEFVDDYVDNEQGASHGPVLLGAGLTVRPVIKRLDPVVLAEHATTTTQVFLHPELIRQLSESLEKYTMNWLDKLKKQLADAGYSQKVIDAITGAYTTAAKNLGEDDAAHTALIASLMTTAKTLSEQVAASPNAPITITLAQPAAGLSAEDVRRVLAEQQTQAAAAARTLAETKAARVLIFTGAIDAAKGLSEGTRTQLKKASDLITADMSDDQVRQLATFQIAQGNELEAARQLSGLGFARAGTPHITIDEGNAIKKMSMDIRTGLRQTSQSESGQLRFIEDGKESRFVAKVLAEFDRVNAQRLHEEAKLLAGGVVNIGNAATIPASYQREVIAQIYQDLKIMELVNANMDPTQSATHTIFYETRDVASVTGGGITPEGGAIQQAGVSMLSAFAYINQRKLALEITNEAIWFSQNNRAVNWDAWARNIASNAQYMRELVATDIANRMQRDSDSYAVTTVAAGGATTAYSGATNGYKVANFPVVQPYQARDLQGTAIGSVENPITFKDGATVLAEYDGTGTQAAARYYKVLSYNLGLFQVVTELGAATAPAGTVTCGYDYTTNVVKVDTDIASGLTYEQQMNKIIQGIGNRNAALRNRFVSPNFLLMSAVLHNMATDAEQFTAFGKRNDSNVSASGDLEPIKAIGAYSTNAPGIYLGDERILIGDRANFWYTVAKAFAMGEPVERVNSSGKFLGKKGSYGEEYASLLVPAPLRARYSSVLAYSVTGARGT